MPKRFHVVITGNHTAKDKYADVQPAGKLMYTSCEGGVWHDMSQEGGEIDNAFIKALKECLHKDPNIQVGPYGHWTAIPILLPNGKGLLAHAIKFPDRSVFSSKLYFESSKNGQAVKDPHAGWDYSLQEKPKRTEDVAGPQW